jgi:two-component system sensor histidine kinase LytS
MTNPLHRAISDAILSVAVLMMVLVAVAGIVVGVPRPVFATAVAGLAMAAFAGLVNRMVTRPDHLKARQSQEILEIADASLAHMRKGLTFESAQAVCRLAMVVREVAAVAITDREVVLGFAGLGEDHHRPGGPIITQATREVLDQGEHRIVSSREEIGCPEKSCHLQAAIIVPLEMQGSPLGTLKFYYTTPRLLSETQVTMVEGLGHLLSTQLELSELDMQMELAREMELKALQSQVNPHFLFNTINTIAMLIRTDPAEARALLREFARFYRRTLENSEDLITLGRELDYVHSYLMFERARFGERLQVDEDIERSVMELMVPAFILQPIVENSVQHGARPDGALHVKISAHEEGDAFIITVEDDGVGIAEEDLPRVLEPGFGRGIGIALTNVEGRLKAHFGSGSGLAISSRVGEGTRVELRIAGMRASVGKVRDVS